MQWETGQRQRSACLVRSPSRVLSQFVPTRGNSRKNWQHRHSENEHLRIGRAVGKISRMHTDLILDAVQYRINITSKSNLNQFRLKNILMFTHTTMVRRWEATWNNIVFTKLRGVASNWLTLDKCTECTHYTTGSCLLIPRSDTNHFTALHCIYTARHDTIRHDDLDLRTVPGFWK